MVVRLVGLLLLAAAVLAADAGTVAGTVRVQAPVTVSLDLQPAAAVAGQRVRAMATIGTGGGTLTNGIIELVIPDQGVTVRPNPRVTLNRIRDGRTTSWSLCAESGDYLVLARLEADSASGPVSVESPTRLLTVAPGPRSCPGR